MSKKETKNFIKKNLKKFLTMAIVIMILILISGNLFVKSQIMDTLEYNITLNEDGSATIVETWDVYVSHTNTLFRNFKKLNKYDNIVDVKVKDLTSGTNLKQIYEEMYHVTTDCFYALTVSSGKFEIAWGTGMENKMGKRTYQITYTVIDAINSYNDCDEFYWKLLDESNGIPVKKVTGTITMPRKAEKKEDLKIWGHGPLNGKIEVTSNDKIRFEVNNLEQGRMLEVRAVTTDKMFSGDYVQIKNYSKLQSIIDEETKWAEESNNETETLYEALIVLYIIGSIINIIQSMKLYKITKRKDDGIIHRDLKYYRDIPRENSSTPPEANYLYYFDKNGTDLAGKQANLVSAVILNLAHKGYIKLRTVEKSVYVSILKKPDGLNDDEKAVYNILKGAHSKENEEFEIDEINKFAKKDYYKYSELINKMINEARESIYKQNLVDKGNQKAYLKAKNANGIYSFILGTLEFLIVGLLIGLIPLFDRAYINMFGVGFKEAFIMNLVILIPFIVTLLIKLKIRSKTQPKIAVLTQKGTEEQEEWKGLANYMKDFSLLDEREIPELELWEKYLVFATSFGIADKVIEQMKAKYPEVFVEEYWKDENVQKYQIINFATSGAIYYTDGYSPIKTLSHNASKAYSTSLSEIASHASSSGSGGGGGFSGGGRWPEAVEAGMGGR